MKFLIEEPFPLLFSSLLGLNTRLGILFSNTLSLHSSLNVRDHVKGGIQAKGIRKQDPEANIWAQEG